MLKLKILTPDKVLVNEDVLSLNIMGELGAMQILPGHMGILAKTTSGEISYQKTNKEIVHLNLLSGILEVENDQINLLCQSDKDNK